MKRICGVVLALAGSALGQSFNFELVVSNIVSPEQPSATVEVWAAFSPALYAFAKARFDLLASADEGGFSDPVLHLQGPGDYLGDIAPDGDSVLKVAPMQFYWPNGGPYGDTSNPILVWSVTWSTSEFDPRTVSLVTLTSEYYVYKESGHWDDYIDTFVEGEGSIQVVPGAGTPAVLGLAALAGLRRRRR